MKKAWRTTWNGITSICSAETRGKAVAKTLHSIDEAGYDIRGAFKSIRALRAPEHDGWAALDETRIIWAEENLPKAVTA